MERVYRSKYSWWMVAIFIALMLLLPMIMVFEGFNIFGAIFSVIYIAFSLDLLCRTSYKIEGKRLRLRAGMFSATLDIDRIISISHTKNGWNENSFAWSTNRLVLRMPKKYNYMVSPVDEKGFIDDLLRINPDINIEI